MALLCMGRNAGLGQSKFTDAVRQVIPVKSKSVEELHTYQNHQVPQHRALTCNASRYTMYMTGDGNDTFVLPCADSNIIFCVLVCCFWSLSMQEINTDFQ